jgi:sortase system peptidoglycan-associated protein
MNTFTKKTIAVLLTAALSTQAMANETEANAAEVTGFSSGAIIGALLGGPVGAIIGAAGGAVIGNEIDEKESVEVINQRQTAEISGLQQELTVLNQQLASTSQHATNLRIQKVSLQTGLDNLTQEISTEFLYQTNDVSIQQRYHTKLDNLASFLNKHKQFKIVINGYADARGSEHDNLKLSLDRVKTVEQYLAAQGVDKQQIVLNAFGEKSAVQKVDSKDAYAFDRKVSLQLLKTEAENQSVASN